MDSICYQNTFEYAGYLAIATVLAIDLAGQEEVSQEVPQNLSLVIEKLKNLQSVISLRRVFMTSIKIFYIYQ